MRNLRTIRSLSRFAATTALAAAATLGLPVDVLAGGPPQGRIIVPGDHFQPGETITIVGSELTDGGELVIRLSRGPSIVELGRAAVASDSTLSTTATIPASFPLGYAELTARDENGNVWSTFVLIGDRAEGPGGLGAGEGLDERTLWLLILGLGLVVVAAAAASTLRVRRRRTATQEEAPLGPI